MICVGIMCQASMWRLQRGYVVTATSQPASCRAPSILAVETGEDYSLGLFAGADRGVGALSLGGSLLTCLFSRLGNVTAIPTHTTLVGTLSATRSRCRERVLYRHQQAPHIHPDRHRHACRVPMSVLGRANHHATLPPVYVQAPEENFGTKVGATKVSLGHRLWLLYKGLALADTQGCRKTTSGKAQVY